MRVGLGLLLLLLGLCGSGAQGEGGGLNEVGDISEFQKTAPRDADEESIERTTKQTTPDIWAEVRALRDRVKDSESQVDELKAELMVTKMNMELLQRENTVQETQMKSLETRLTATESKTRGTEEENADLQTRLRNSESELVVAKSRIEQLERENAEKPKVAFYAALTDAGNVGRSDTDITLKFSKVYTNIGNAYNPATGFFTAPVNGVYYLQFTVCSNQDGLAAVYVYKNNQRILYNREWEKDGALDYFTNSVVLELTAGDEIHLVLPSGNSVYDDGNNYTTFSGALLFPL